MKAELKIQKMLRSYPDALNRLSQAPYHLTIKNKENLYIFKYNTYDSIRDNDIVKEARGIILDKNDNWNVVCYGFNRFYNYGELEADKIGNKLQVYDKIDGSLCRPYFYKNKWYLASNNNIDARDIEINGKINFFELFEKCLATYNITWDYFTRLLNPSNTYMFEMTSPENEVVIHYPDYRIWYLGERNNTTFQEYYMPITCVNKVRRWDFSNLNEIAEAAKNLTNNDEGFVVVDEHWHRNKVKNPEYLLRHRMANNGKPNLLEQILTGNTQEFLSYFPQYTEEVNHLKQLFKDIKVLAENYHKWASYIWDLARKDYAAQVQRDVPKYLQSYVYKVYENHELTWEDFTRDWSVNKWEKFLEDKR